MALNPCLTGLALARVVVGHVWHHVTQPMWPTSAKHSVFNTREAARDQSMSHGLFRVSRAHFSVALLLLKSHEVVK